LANAPVSCAIHIDAIVPDVNRNAIRRGRAMALCAGLLSSAKMQEITVQTIADFIEIWDSSQDLSWSNGKVCAHMDYDASALSWPLAR
jgi:hypothetical protein